PRRGLPGDRRDPPRRDPARGDRPRPGRGDGADARGPPRAPHAPPPLRSVPGARVRRGGRGDGGRPPRLGRGAHRGRARGLPRAGGQPEEVHMSEIGDALARELGRDRVADDAAALAAHRTDYWILAHLRARQGRLTGGPACVVTPRSTAEVATAVRLAARHGVAVVPYGAGSGVVGGATPPAGSLVVDLAAMSRLLERN